MYTPHAIGMPTNAQNPYTSAGFEGVAGALRPGGALVVGVSESLLRLGTGLDPVERDGTFFYRRAP